MPRSRGSAGAELVVQRDDAAGGVVGDIREHCLTLRGFQGRPVRRRTCVRGELNQPALCRSGVCPLSDNGLCVRCKRAAGASVNLVNRVAHLRFRESLQLQFLDQLRLREGVRVEGALRYLDGLRVPVAACVADGVRRFRL